MGNYDAQELPRPKMSVATITTDSIEALQSTEQRELMDLVDRLRRAGLSTLLQLPQIVVCGDQSSGKSSVLEAITEIPFPRKENLCTRFATEISLRRDLEDSITCKINPDESRNEEEFEDLRSFSKTISNFGELPALIDEATEAMGLGPSKAFSRDVLSIEICGPSRPQLTLIDLPGLIHSSNKSQSEEDVELIRSLVKEYISKQRTIMLAVISARNDYANQIILKMCREFDTKGSRTLGIITKPDFLRPGSENEATWLDLARNKDIHFELGWHLLKNRGDEQHSMSFAQRNLDEQMFFKAGNYQSLPQSMLGVRTLRDRLSQLLFDHLRRGLPDLKEELDTMLSHTLKDLESLGQSRESLPEQRIFLAELAKSATSIIRMACDGTYDAAFFGDIDVDAAIDAGQNSLRLRAVVQYQNLRFADRIRTHGHTYCIAKEFSNEEGGEEVANIEQNDEQMVDIDQGDEEDALQPWTIANQKSNKNPTAPIEMTRREAITWVKHVQERIRGRELPGVFNPMVIGHIFQEQSVKWEQIALRHIDSVAEACKKFVFHVLASVATAEVKDKLTTTMVLPFLKQAHVGATLELKRILKDKTYHPITYNHYFTDTIQKIQQDRYTSYLMDMAEESTVQVAAKTFTGGPGYEDRQYIDPRALKHGLQRTIQQDMSKFAAEQALDAHDAFYKDERKYFVDAVTKQTVERHLLAPLIDIISPRSIAGYSDAQLRHIASEPGETKSLRTYLDSKRKMLEDGHEAFQDAIGRMETAI